MNLYKILLFVSLFCIQRSAAIRPLPWDFLRQPDQGGDIWALLIAGSAGWNNYRHQADVAHSYHVLIQGGVKPEHIVVMAYDDIANNDENPRPGSIYNHPTGIDVYEDLKIDYACDYVNAETFLAVLAGNKSAVHTTRFSSGRVIEARANDRLFLFYSDHGAPGVLGMPSGPFLYADQLHHVIKHRSKSGGFKEMVMYIEACESGSIFEGLLEDDLNIFAVTAANGHESSWGCYCPMMDPPPPEEFNTCLGDLFSVSWMEDSDRSNLNQETLKKQFQLVKARTSSNFTYTQGSHVMRYGQFNIDEEPVADFLGALNDGLRPSAIENALPLVDAHLVMQRTADLMPLMHKAAKAVGDAKQQAQRALDEELNRRKALDQSILAALHRVYTSFEHVVQSVVPLLMGSPIETLMTMPLPTRSAGAVVDDWNCLRGMVNTWERACGPLGDYGMQHTRSFANLCNSGVAPDDVFEQIAAASCGARVDGDELANAAAAM